MTTSQSRRLQPKRSNHHHVSNHPPNTRLTASFVREANPVLYRPAAKPKPTVKSPVKVKPAPSSFFAPRSSKQTPAPDGNGKSKAVEAEEASEVRRLEGEEEEAEDSEEEDKQEKGETAKL